MPAVDAVAADRGDEVAFVGVAGRSDLEATAAAADELFDHLAWGLDDDVWVTYEVAAQPYTVLVTSDGVVVDRWFGAVGEEEIRARVEALVETGS